ncbi:hypothetical protein PoB_003101000 [Plakobranchus ocellatus]|uniref:Uncharacterized protein n=1 Tax=Plakobranchus ocellatus TaxID=259542 RepID=A0AAV4AAU1_9GAST|nr:hypothetical protein PoB_003101000 [Plakobranchus ocellatus]
MMRVLSPTVTDLDPVRPPLQEQRQNDVPQLVEREHDRDPGPTTPVSAFKPANPPGSSLMRLLGQATVNSAGWSTSFVYFLP